METRFGGEAQFLCGMGPMDLRPMEKRTLEWDLNDWKWDGDLFIATQLNEVPSDELTQKGFFPVCGPQVPPSGGSSSNCSSSCSVDVNLGIEKGKREVEKRRRVTTSLNNGEEQGSNLSLKLGGGGGGGDRYGVNERELGSGWEEETSGKKTKLVGGVSSRSGACQVQDCGADLSTAKDYHRRHKVCEIHSKASKALVGNVLQRFCQQCSRFHALQEFDEGRRSCRRRLAGHNQRRRKTNPDPVVDKSPSPDDQNSGYLLMSLLKILSNMHSNGSNQTTDQDMLSHLVRSLACQTSDQGGRNISGFLQESPNFLTNRNSIGVSELASKFLSNGPQVCPSRLTGDYPPGPSSETPEQGGIMGSDKSKGRDVEITSLKPSISNSPPSYTENRETAAGQSKVINFDLNDIYVDSDDGMEDMGRLSPPENLGTSSLECPSWVQQDSHQSSPPQTSGNSESVFAPSPSSSNGEAQSRTGRIVFKLFGKEPNDFPLVLRSQIFDWLSNSPSDIESYIRPGCVILTIYLRQTESAWDKLCYDLSASLNRLLQVSDDAFWKTGWIYIRLEHQIAFVNHGQVVIDTSLPLRGDSYGRIVSVKPIAVSASESARFSVRGSNLIRPATRLLCALEGKYLAQTSIQESKESLESSREQNDIQCVSFSCSIPIINGRGFIEVEDQGLSSSFIPFIVAEEDVCSEIRLLETAFEPTEIDSVNSESSRKPEVRNQAMNFIHEMGWLLHRTQLKSRPGDLGPNPDLFPLERFKWLVAFSMDRDWHAVVKKLLDVLLDGRAVGFGDYPSLRFALSEMGLLHRAVRRSSRPLVGLLIGYNSKAFFDTLESEEESDPGFLFRPDAKGPAGLTPLHIAAGKDGSEEIIDALTDDPAKVGLEAWKSARDSTGSTPEDYARLRGHYSYIHLVQKKINQRTTSSGQVILDIPRILSENSTNLKSDVNDQLTTEFKAGSFELNCPVRQNCGLCARKVGAHQGVGRSLVYRPAMLSMVAVAAVCVCVALLFKSSPEVLYVFQPFRWESLEFGTS